jgi:histidinol-phosphate aminotransferase
VIWPRSAGAVVDAVPVNENYLMEGEAIVAALQPETRMLIFGNPSNPVGTSITADDLRLILSRIGAQTLLVFDEAYLEYAATDPSYPDFLSILETAQTPWLMLRTFSKAYGLAGVRVGYAIASDPELISLMDRVRAPFNVNRLAQIAAIAALEDMDYVRGVVRRTIGERERVRTALTSRGYRTSPSRANFLFVQGREDSSELSRRLLTKGVIVKPWQEPGYEDHLRVSIGSPEDNDLFLDAWTALAR